MANYTLTSGGSVLEVTDADECESLQDAIALFREVANIPANPTVLVDSVPVDDLDFQPEDGAEIALNKPTGEKG